MLKIFSNFTKVYSKVFLRFKSLHWYIVCTQRVKLYSRRLGRYIKRVDGSFEERIYFILGFILFLFGILTLTLLISFIRNLDLFNQKQKVLDSGNIASRVDIVDRNGVTLAKDIFSYDLYLKPHKLKDPEVELQKIVKILPKTKNKLDIIRKGVEAKRGYKNGSVLIQMGISTDERLKLIDNGVIGIEFQKKKARYYIHNNILCHILGFVSDDGVGIAGIEKSISSGKINYSEKLELSIDLRVQNILYSELKDLMKKHSANGAFGLIFDVNNGEILAATSLPDFNPNDKSTMVFDTTFNKFALGVYEFGSVFKIFNTILALENGLKKNKIYNIKEDLEVDGRKISDMIKRREKMTLEEVLMYSSNIGSGKILLDIGADKQRQMFEDLGFFEKINTELPESGRTIFYDKKNWHGIRAVTMTYGHGISITQLHLARAFSAVINGGNLINLTFLKRRDDDNCIIRRVFSQDSSEKMLSIIRGIVQNGAAGGARSSYYDIGGKGGTAIKILGNGVYAKNKNLLTFVSAFPMKSPKYGIILSLDEPQWSEGGRFRITGGSVLSPVAKSIIHSMGFILGIEKMTTDERQIIDLERISKSN